MADTITLPALTGTDKQVAFAATIRDRAIACLNAAFPDAFQAVAPHFPSAAAWWLDNLKGVTADVDPQDGETTEQAWFRRNLARQHAQGILDAVKRISDEAAAAVRAAVPPAPARRSFGRR